jgi:hydroxypyruvate reductase
MQQALETHGARCQLYSELLTGEARAVANDLVGFITREGGFQADALLAGGETTVTLMGHGKGGRNQEMALAFALAAERQGLAGNWVFMSAGTDGRDGPTDAAGGLVDSGSLARMRARGADPGACLEANDSYHALEASDDLLLTGATGTNVADLQLFLRV